MIRDFWVAEWRIKQDAVPAKGLYGAQVELVDGSTILAEDAYPARSAREPPALVVAGCQPEMLATRFYLWGGTRPDLDPWLGLIATFCWRAACS